MRAAALLMVKRRSLFRHRRRLHLKPFDYKSCEFCQKKIEWNLAAPDIVAGALRHRRPRAGGLQVCRFSCCLWTELVASVAAWTNRLRRITVRVLLSLRR